jgi:hypothetical protein
LIVAAIPVGYFIAPAVGQISPETLFYSVTSEVDGTVPQVNPCNQQGGSRWTCRISDRGVSGYALYDVELRGNCWTAVKTFSAEEEPLPATEQGCVHVADQLRLGTRLFDALVL